MKRKRQIPDSLRGTYMAADNTFELLRERHYPDGRFYEYVHPADGTPLNLICPLRDTNAPALLQPTLIALAGRLQELPEHPHVARHDGSVEVDGKIYFLVEWLAEAEQQGSLLYYWIWRGSLSVDIALQFGAEICAGLAHLAAHGFPCHGNLRPALIAVTTGRRIKLLLPGLPMSRPGNGEADRVDGLLLADPYILAPELWQGAKPDARSDVYAVGCLIYALLGGKPFVPKKDVDAIREGHLRGEYKDLTFPDQIAGPLNDLLRRCLALHPEDRFTDAAALGVAIGELHERCLGKPIISHEARPNLALDTTTIGLALMGMQRYQEAIDLFTRVLAEHGDIAHTYLARGISNVVLGKNGQAFDDLEKAEQIDHRLHPYLLCSIGIHYRATGEYQKSQQAFVAALEQMRELVWAYSELAILLERMGQHEEALDCWRVTLELSDSRSLLFLPMLASRAKFHASRGAYDLALQDWGTVLTIEPRFARAYLSVANTLADLGRSDEAIANYDKYLALMPDDSHAHFNRAHVLNELGRNKEAIAGYSQAIAINPRDSKALTNRGIIYADQGDLEQALADFDASLALDAEDATTYYSRANLWIRRAMRAIHEPVPAAGPHTHTGLERVYYERAYQDSTQALYLQPKLALAYIQRAGVSEALGNDDGASTDLRRAIDLAPQESASYERLGKIAYRQGLYDEALKLFTLAMQYGSTTAAANAARVKQRMQPHMLQRLSEPQTAREAFDAVFSLDELREAVRRFPDLTEPAFVTALEQEVAQRPRGSPSDEAGIRLWWLRELVSERRRQVPAPTAEILDLQPSTIVHERFMVERILVGGQAVAAVVSDRREKQVRVLKTIRPDYSHSREVHERLKAEIYAISRIGHPFVVKYHEVLELGDTFALLMDYCRLGSLRDHIPPEGFSEAQVVLYALQICLGMDACREALPGLTHRDLKPENLLLTDQDHVRVADFGLAALREPHFPALGTDEFVFAKSGALVGTLPYMSPEQLAGREDLDVRSDIYALGVILYELLTGMRPYGGSLSEIVEAATGSPSSIPPLCELRPDLRPQVIALVERCLAADRESRFQSWNAILDEFERFVLVTPPDVPPPEKGQPQYAIVIANRPTYFTLYGRWPHLRTGLTRVTLHDVLSEVLSRADSLLHLGRETEALAEIDAALGIVEDLETSVAHLIPRLKGTENLTSLSYNAENNDYTIEIRDPKLCRNLLVLRSKLISAVLERAPEQIDIAYARRNAELMLRLFPDDSESIALAAQAYLLSDEYDRAFDMLYDAYKKTPSSMYVRWNFATYWYEYGISMMGEGKLREAVDAFRFSQQLGHSTAERMLKEMALGMAKGVGLQSFVHNAQLHRTFERARSVADMRERIQQNPLLADPKFTALVVRSLKKNNPPLVLARKERLRVQLQRLQEAIADLGLRPSPLFVSYRSWIETHAQRWDQAGRPEAALLAGMDNLRASCWIASPGGRKTPLSELGAAFVAASRFRGSVNLSQRSHCSSCGERYKLENLGICTACDDKYCYRCTPAGGTHANGNQACGCGGEVVG
jgi:serine/threonine protein kinase/Tfp pilus assembly protein PilF